MKPEELLKILNQVSELKKATRHCWTDGERKESVADHSWRMALMAMLLCGEEEFRNLDMNKVIKMCLIHDLGEAFTGDIPTFEKTNEHSEYEEDILNRWIKTFPVELKNQWQILFVEMKEMNTKEAMLYKALDKLEAVISHNESDIMTWLPLEYDLQYTYGKENVKFSNYLMELKKYIDDVTTRKIKEFEVEKFENPC